MKQLSLLPDLVPVELTLQEKRNQLFESLGGMYRVRLFKQLTTEIIYPGKILWIFPKKPVLVHRIFDSVPKWQSASVEWCEATKDEVLWGSDILRYYDTWKQGKKFQVSTSGELCSFDPIAFEKVRQQNIFATKHQTLRFIWQWFLHAYKIEDIFCRKTLKLRVETKDSFILNDMLDETKTKVTATLKAFDLSLDDDIFQQQFWSAIELVCSYGTGENLPELPDSNRICPPITQLFA